MLGRWYPFSSWKRTMKWKTEDFVQQNEAVKLGLEMSAGGGKAEEVIESLEENKKDIENGGEEGQALDERNPRRAAVGTN